MSATVLSDAVTVPAAAGDPEPAAPAPGEAVESAKCDCCGLTEECTPAYIERVRERYDGRWVCGLCAEAVTEEICRSSPRLVSTEEALARHMAFCRGFRSSPAPEAADANEHLIAAMRQLLRRSLDSPRAPRSAPSSPRRKMSGELGSPRASLAPPGGYFSPFAG